MNSQTLHRFGLILILLCWLVLPPIARSDPTPTATQEAEQARTITIEDPMIVLAPYVWKVSGVGASARAEATMPGAYLRLRVGGTHSIRLLVDESANKGCPPASMPVVDYSVDHGPFATVQLTSAEAVYPLTLADKLEPAKPHDVNFYFRSANLGPNRWHDSTVHLRIHGVQMDAGGSLAPLRIVRTLPSASAIRSPKASASKGSAPTTRTCS